MECMKCKGKMIEARLSGSPTGMSVYLAVKKPGLLESERQSAVACYVCTDCGFVELRAENPKGLIIE